MWKIFYLKACAENFFPSFFFYYYYYCFLEWANLISPSLWKKLKLWKLPNIKCSTLTYRVPLWPTYIGERWTTFTKAYGTKVRCYGEHVEEHIENLMGTDWELEGNWEQIGNHEFLKKILPKTYKEENQGTLSACLGLPIAAWNFSSEKSSSPFLAWANTPCKEHTTYQGEYFLCKRTGILNNKTPTTERGLSKRFFGVDGPLWLAHHQNLWSNFRHFQNKYVIPSLPLWATYYRLQ